MKINENKLLFLSSFTYFVSMYIGSYIYIFSGSLTIMNIMLFICITFTIRPFLYSKFNMNEYAVLYILFSLFLITLIVGLYTGGDTVKNALYFFHGFGIYLILITLRKSCFLDIEFFENIIFYGVIILVLVTILQVLDILNILKVGIVFRNELYGVKLISGTFKNPNDLSVVAYLSLISYAIIGYASLGLKARNIKKDMFLYFAVLFLVASSLSRIVFVLFIISSFFYFKWLGHRSFNKVFSTIFLSFSLFFFLVVLGSGYDLGTSELSLVVGRMESIINIALGGEDGSASSRLDNYTYSLSHLSDIPFFGYFEETFDSFYKNANFSTEVYRITPHAYILEILFSYGLLGFIFILMFFSMMIKQITFIDKKLTHKVFFLFFVFSLTSFIPSSIVKLPVIYMLFTLVIISIINVYKYKDINLQ